WLGSAKALDPFGHLMRGAVGIRDHYAVGLGLTAVLLDHVVRIKPPGDPRGVVKLTQRGHHATDALRALHLPERDGAAVDEPRHEPALFPEVARDLGTQSNLGRPQAGLVLDLAVDPEEPGLGAAHPEDEGFAANIHPEVVV